MKINSLIIFTLLIALVGCQSSSVSSTSAKVLNHSLYLELGGPVKLNTVIVDMVTRLHSDERLSKLFIDIDDTELVTNFNTFICRLTDGGCEYNGASMEDIHAELYITKAEFDRFVSLFILSMQSAKIPFAAQNKLLDRLSQLRNEVIEL